MIELPQEFLARMKDMLGDKFDDFLSSYEKDKISALRINTLKTDGEAVKSAFALKPVPWCEQGYYYPADARPGKHVLHEAGAYYIQEPSAMAVVENLDVQEGDTILDLCSAPGGKSTQIASKLNGTGLLVANEIIPSRAKILSQNIERMGIVNCVVLNESPQSLARRFCGIFDKILVDAPCSGEGMFRKNQLAIDEWSLSNVIACKQRQLDILECAVTMLKSGGAIVYSTCTFSMEEDEQVVDEFLARHEDFEVASPEYQFCNGFAIEGGSRNEELKRTGRIFPHLYEGEGHFFAVLKHKADGQERRYSEQSPKISPAQMRIFDEWKKQNLNIDATANLAFGDNLYAMAKGTPRLDGLKVERAGLHLGSVVKNRFEPSHSLALALKPCQSQRSIKLSLDDAVRYISGQTLEYEGEKGWAVATYADVTLGWCKCDGVYAKNHYPKGLRR